MWYVNMLSRKKYILISITAFFILAGFDFSRHSIPLNEIVSGGPPKDGIPALYDPKFISKKKARYLNADDRILGIEINNEARAYPIRILNWHELVNDRVGGMDILISYCPLCGTGMAFDSRINDKRFLFGVSGKLYNSDVLFYDKKTESLWSQIGMEAVAGPMTGQKLDLLPLLHTSWKAWKRQYPETKVLSIKTGYSRNYSLNPYRVYSSSERLYFPVSHKDSRLLNKDWIIGVLINGKAKAYPFDALRKKQTPVEDVVGGKTVFVSYDPEGDSAVVKDLKGKALPSIQGYWFAWAAFYPTTEVYTE